MMKDRLFSIMGFGKRSGTLAARLKLEGINYGWGVKTRLLLILIDCNDTDSFVVRLCQKAKAKGCRVVFISLNPELSTMALGDVAGGFLFNDNEEEVAAIVKALHDVTYKHNILSYDINDMTRFLQTGGTGRIVIQTHEFSGLDISQVGKISLPQEENAQVRHLTLIRLCQPPDKDLFDGIGKVFTSTDGFTLNVINEDDTQPTSELIIISIIVPIARYATNFNQIMNIMSEMNKKELIELLKENLSAAVSILGVEGEIRKAVRHNYITSVISPIAKKQGFKIDSPFDGFVNMIDESIVSFSYVSGGKEVFIDEKFVLMCYGPTGSVYYGIMSEKGNLSGGKTIWPDCWLKFPYGIGWIDNAETYCYWDNNQTIVQLQKEIDMATTDYPDGTIAKEIENQLMLVKEHFGG